MLISFNKNPTMNTLNNTLSLNLFRVQKLYIEQVDILVWGVSSRNTHDTSVNDKSITLCMDGY